jgi:hypothetical protein
MRSQQLLAVAVALVGLVVLAVGVIYLTVDAKSLPSILGPLHRVTGHRSARGIAAIIAGVVLLAGGGLLAYTPRASH